MRDNLDDLRHIEGFPIGEDEDLHALSDPPHYTAYPNPHVAEFIEKWGTLYDEATDDYHREPYVADVSEGKNDPIYNAHSYHTKVPYKAIIPFIEHYTEPGDVIFDGFCGTGMTGIAAQILGRRVILCDLSPAATFIAYNFNVPVDMTKFTLAARHILKEVEAECSWMYETWHPNCDTRDRVKGYINYTIWSDVFLCPYCGQEIIFWDAAVDHDVDKVRETFPCPGCNAQVTKQALEHAKEHVYDSTLGREVERARHVPVLINYRVGRQRYEKQPDSADLALVVRVENSQIPYWYPTTRIDRDIDIWYERDYRQLGVFSVDAFFTKRNLWCVATQWSHIQKHLDKREYKALAFVLTGNIGNMSKMNRWPRLRGPLAGTLYIPSIYYEINPVVALQRRVKRVRDIFAQLCENLNEGSISTNTCSDLSLLPTSSCDYIFTDPPFGSNIIYSDLSIIWESWLRAFTSTGHEIVVHRRKKQNAVTLDGYRTMMTRAFAEMYRVLKPRRWITIVFHNSRASVWNAIQEALARAGFLVAQVTVLDKKQGSYKQVTAPGAVKNDLVINAYKPRAGFTERFVSQAGQRLEAQFVHQHLEQLPPTANVERTQEMLYSKYLAYYVQHGYQVAYNAEQFYRALPQWGFVELDGYWFAGEAQANEYETHKAKRSRPRGKVARKQSVLFISDERSARQWLWSLLETPMTYDEIYTAFVKALQTPEDQIPELKQMLEEGFVRTDGKWKRPDALAREEMEAKRQARLLRQFEEYLEAARAGRRLREVRKEALVAGFTEAYREGRFQDILAVGRRLPKRLLESSPDLFDFIDIAEAKVEG